MRDPPKRTESQELTLVSPRSSLPPVSAIPGPTIEQLADIERARRDLEDSIDTLVACPGPCTTCPCCNGAHMVTHARRQQWLEENEPPPSRPEAA